MPSLELFVAQSEEYRRRILPADVPVVAVEAARGGIKPVDPETIPPAAGVWRAGWFFLVPFAVLIDEQGVLRSKGLTNNREHLESLFEAMERGVASIQEFMEQRVGADRRQDVA